MTSTERPSDEDIFSENNFICVYCDFNGRDFKCWAYLQVDHFIPKSKGGKDLKENLVTSCIICNNMKGAQNFGKLNPDNLKKAREIIQGYWKDMEKYWEVNVQSHIK